MNNQLCFCKDIFSIPCLLHTKKERNDQTCKMCSLTKTSGRVFCEHWLYVVKAAVSSVNFLVSHYFSTIPLTELKDVSPRSNCSWWFRVLLESLENQLSVFFLYVPLVKYKMEESFYFVPPK